MAGRSVLAWTRLSAARAVPVAAALTLAACGIPVDEQYRSLRSEDVPFNLQAPPTTPTTGAAPTFDDTAIPEFASLYFVVEDRLVEVRREFKRSPSLDQLVRGLTDGPERGSEAPELRTVIREDQVQRVTARAGVANVELARSLNELSPAERRLAVAQLVLTLTDRPGIGQVAFTLEQDTLVDLARGDGTLADGAVSRDDYANLLQTPGA